MATKIVSKGWRFGRVSGLRTQVTRRVQYHAREGIYSTLFEFKKRRGVYGGWWV